MQDKIIAELKESIEVKNQVIKKICPQIEQAAKAMTEALKKGNKVLFFGNGGSAADAQHLTAELIGRYKKDRRSLPAVALSTDTSTLTSLANDYGFETIFAKQIEGLAQKGDIAFGISTSGNSRNILEGLEKAREQGCKTIGLLGCDGGRIAEVSDIAIIVPCKSTPRIQESHITIGHIICGLIEQEIFPQ
ncbi:MAG: D-sedoheptulose 7-phosphate isomerase [Candidatus Margulisbacteria bacterium]|nr:D-sedoheptulose 7-phosphate isomerase [Candidatus Margulisiibacteriota bacterium]